MANAPKNHGISLESVTFYLDAVERDRLDSMGAGGRASEVIALRERLLRLPEDSFQATVTSIRALLADHDGRGPLNTNANTSSNDKQDQSRKLYDETRTVRTGGAGGILSKVKT